MLFEAESGPRASSYFLFSQRTERALNLAVTLSEMTDDCTTIFYITFYYQ